MIVYVFFLFARVVAHSVSRNARPRKSLLPRECIKERQCITKVFANRSVAWFKVSAAAIAISYDFAWRFPLGSRSPYESPYIGKYEEQYGRAGRERERESEIVRDIYTYIHT